MNWKKAIVGIGLVAGTVASMGWNRVIEVIDGDTFRMANGQKVRMLGIDAPELEFCGGVEAKIELEKLIKFKKVELTEIKADKFGRLLAVVYENKKLINEVMIENGWARWDGTNNNLGTVLTLASEVAREKEKGVYSDKCRAPDNKKCLIKGNIEKRSGTTSRGRKLYFFEGCSEYKSVVVEKELGEQWFCTEEEARKAGYEKAGNCFDKKAVEIR